jgi:SAM-dependent methyltransferase
MVHNFKALPNSYKENSDKYGCLYSFDDFETLNYDAYSCPHCNASDRDRLYALYISKRLTEYVGANLFLLEIAPSRPLSAMLKKTGKITLRTADLMMDGVDDLTDITGMDCYSVGSFDIFICSHVLEHVPDDLKALHELFRILKPNGWGILMVPIIPTLDKIDEDPLVTNIGERWQRFCQDDHVRMYSKIGLIKRAEECGFIVSQFGQEYFGVHAFEKHGISDKSVLYVVKKKFLADKN